ncbi:unnamed protein product [Paramecium pentaurelia]|uniref:Peptidase S9 prolyl oligopeptidase catalytic domain-containing protein n=1 Tax=Paramecium pentaurelia TaxID=43138 RepID=A0A8S1U1K4_9CILI|nr:unnamed protein product [Paramecium pentaurelia]
MDYLTYQLCLILTLLMLFLVLMMLFSRSKRFRSFIQKIKSQLESLLDKIIFPARSCNEYQNISQQDLKVFSVVRKNVGEEIQNQRCNNIELNRIVLYAYLRNDSFANTEYNVIYFHGNGETIDEAAYFVRNLMKSLQFNAFLIEYPKYGIYKYTETSAKIILEDSILAYEHIKDEYQLDESKIFIFGRSIGTGPAIHVASQKKCKGLIIISAFKSLKSLIREMVFGIGYLVSKFMDERFNNEENIKKIQCPALFIHGVDDTLIPSTHSIFLQKQLNNQNKESRLELFPHMAHNNITEFNYEISEKISLNFRELSKAND